jgi:hypothetical protein
MKIYIILAVSLMLFLQACGGTDKYNAFADCLTDEGAKMFGAYWCPHCQEQKKEFSNSWNRVDYIECSLPNRGGQTELCNRAGIQGYPTWEFADGSRESGRLSMEKLSQKTGCDLPE